MADARIQTADVAGTGVGSWLVDALTGWGITELTHVQGLALAAGVADSASMIVSAPTSSGKTLVGEVAILSSLRANHRVLYLVSHKALADQKYADFEGRFGARAVKPIASVALNTGDRSEGPADARLMVATYEKALAMLLSRQLRPAQLCVIADEFQIVGEPGRGPEIETLTAILRKSGVGQFVALTATVDNPEDLAAWMNCKLVQSFHRDVPLHQEVWYDGWAYRTTFGQDIDDFEERECPPFGDLFGIVDHLLRRDLGPVLVFTETRREAADYARDFGARRPVVQTGIALAQQLDLFSEPTESSAQLQQNAERRVAFHSADLTPQERQIVEQGFVDSEFEVCFATSTLAAGVNFPFRTVLFAKLTYQYGDRQGSQIERSNYRNMSGRAGRLGMHDDGLAILVPENGVEFEHAKQLVSPDNDRVISRLVGLSLRKTVLTLVASRVAASFAEIMAFFENTLYWHLILEHNPAKLDELRAETAAALEWLVANEMLSDASGTLLVTPLGRMTAMSGLLPSTAVNFVALLKSHPELDAEFDALSDALIYAVCGSDEFRAERPTRYLPYPNGKQGSDSISFWSSRKLLTPLDRNDMQLAKCARAMALFVRGEVERKIAYATGVSSGFIHRLALDVAWVLDGLHKVACVPDLGCSQALANKISMLARQARWGAPAEALDVMRLAERHSVPGFGRQRAMALLADGLETLHDILGATKERLVKLLRNERRADALLAAVNTTVGLTSERLEGFHHATAERLGIGDFQQACEDALGTAYEKAIANFLNVETSWVVTELDDGTRQNVPDLLLSLGERSILIECKTCTKSPPTIKKEEAWAVLQKAADYDADMRRVTLGKPAFDETSMRKAAAAKGITLVTHSAFMEALLRVHAGSLTPTAFLEWLGQDGVADLARLEGAPTFAQETQDTGQVS
ncbi:MAG: DEAD/DEAH box helicase [Hyphomonadaceae bacterium]|nr:DEAD/DEAH box helicase [Hyphomonadaceae bacterium]